MSQDGARVRMTLTVRMTANPITRMGISVEDGWLGQTRTIGGLRAEGPSWSTMAYSITRSARSRIDCGIVSPKASAVLRLIINSNLVGCSTGKSLGWAPLRILST